MDNKQEILQYIKNLASQRVLSKEEIIMAYNEGLGVKNELVIKKKLGVAEILYFIGGAIVFLGISILIWQNWSILSATTKILATLGSGIVAYFIGLVLSRNEKSEAVGIAFYLISALVIPLGLYVVFDTAGFNMGSFGVQSLISLILFIVYLISYFATRKTVFVLFSILFGTWLFFSFTSFLIKGNSYLIRDIKIFEYRVLIAGLAYILLGHFFSKGEKAPLTGFLYGFGILGFLGAALALGGWSPRQNVFWELIFPALALGTLFLSINLKSGSFLTFGTLFIMVYILKITAEYFTRGLGWPLALVIAGLMLIAIGYLSFYLKKKYISS